MACDYHALPHPGIQNLAPYIPGKSAESLAKEQGIEDIIKLASNENPLGCSPMVTKALYSLSANKIATYPSATDHPLPSKLAEKLGINQNMLILGNGSDALFPLILNCFALHQNRHVLIHDYAFISYAIHAQTLGIPVIRTPLLENWQVDVEAMLNFCEKKTGIIFLANPNNPTGSQLSINEIKKILQNIPETTLLVVDEAYHEYKQNAEANSAISLLKAHPNLIVTRTFSKAYGLGGLRLGYAVANDDIIAILQRAQPPFTVNQAALAAGLAALDDHAFLTETWQTNAQGMDELQQALQNMQLSYLPPAGNFITFDCKMDGAIVFEALLKEGIIVRPLHPYGLNSFLRVTIGTMAQNKRLIDKLSVCLDKRYTHRQ